MPTYRTYLLIRDVAILCLALFCLVRGPHMIERYLESRLPRLVDCSKPLKEGEHRIELVHADGRAKLHCEAQVK